MKKYKIILLICLLLILVGCKTKEKESLQVNTNAEKSLFADGTFKGKNFTEVKAKIDYLDNDAYDIKIRIDKGENFQFNTENQNVYLDIYIHSNRNNDGIIKYQKDINDKKLITVPLKNNQIPHIIEFKLDQNSKILTEQEHKDIREKARGLWASVQLRDPDGIILQVSNIIFKETD